MVSPPLLFLAVVFVVGVIVWARALATVLHGPPTPYPPLVTRYGTAAGEPVNWELADAPKQVFQHARAANQSELRERAEREMVALGGELPPIVPTEDPEMVGELTAALDAYAAAGAVLDEARTIPDVVGALVLVRLGRDAMERARALRDAREVPTATPLCFFNPLHGDAARWLSWRLLQQDDEVQVLLCERCAGDVRAWHPPEVLTDEVDGSQVPYFEVPAAQSLWSATGYNVFGGDLVERVLRGEHRRGQAG